MDFHRFTEYFERCHELYGMLGGILSADHWQSPTFAGSVVSQSGDETKSIIANFNDYKRDAHDAGKLLEKLYGQTYAKQTLLRTPVVLSTVSGMAAFTVASLYIRSKMQKNEIVAVGEHSYFENKEVLEMIFPKESVIQFDEREPEVLREQSPRVIVVDTICNDPSVTVSDLKQLYTVIKSIHPNPFLIVDSTATTALDLPVPSFPSIFFESLNKFHQFGLDRVTGGMLVGYGMYYDELYRIRDHSGMSLPEASAMTIPTPQSSLMHRYLHTLRNNTDILRHEVEKVSGIIVRVAATKKSPIGTFLSVEVPEHSFTLYRKVIQKALSLARKEKIPLLAGTTFGTPVTRLYTWTTRSKFERPFLRITPGLEDSEEIQKVGRIMRESLQSCVH